MDVSPEVLRDVEFREQWRGYSPDEVDNYLERLATVIEQLEARLRAADERTARAEARAQESSGAERDLRRTLVLAQRTADAAVAEAQAEAARTTTEADRHATEVVVEAERRASELAAEAEGRAAELVADAEREAAELLVEGRRRAVEEEAEARRLLREEVEALHAARGALQADVEALTTFLDAERGQAIADLERQLEWLRAPGRARPDAPASSGATVPPAAPVSIEAALPATAAVPAVDGIDGQHDTSATAAASDEVDGEVDGEGHAPDAPDGLDGGDQPHTGEDDPVVAATDDALADADADVDPVAGLVQELGDLVAPPEPVVDHASAPADVDDDETPDAAPAAAEASLDDHDHDHDHDDDDDRIDLDLDLDVAAARLDDAAGAAAHDDTGEHAAIGDDIPWGVGDERPAGGGALFDDAAADGPSGAYPDDKYMAQLRTAFDEGGAPTDEDRMLFGRPDDADPYDDAGRFWRRRR